MTKYFRYLFIFLFLSTAIFSCIPNKKIVYLQDKSKEKPQDYQNTITVPAIYLEYKLQSEDILSIQISKLPTIDRLSADPIEITNSSRTQIMHPYLTGLPIDSRGMVDIPTLGEIEVRGLTIDQAQRKINKIATESYSLPSVRVFLMNFNVTILGEVRNAGRFPVYTTRINVLEAIGIAGDCTDFAERDRVKILRTENGKSEIFYLDLTNENMLKSERFYLHPNDVVMIAPLKSKKFAGRGSQTFIELLSALAVVTSVLINLSR
ncbi:MAG: polysaccharide biosynthesis/export family protein [Bacteroidota bacterium]